MSGTSVLYDVPGPKARLRYRLYGLLSLISVVALLAYVVYKLNQSGQFSSKKWEIFQYVCFAVSAPR